MTTNTKNMAGREWDSQLRKGYDREAHQYDALRYESPEGRFFNELELQILRDAVQPYKRPKVLDLPAGTGRISLGLAQMGARMFGADLSAGMLKAASSKAGAEGVSNVHFTQANAGKLPFRDETFDAVLSFKFFHLIPNHVKPVLVREMIRVLKPGGKLVIEFNSPFYGGVLAFLRYYFRKAQPGGMRMKCLFPDQVSPLFEGLRISRKHGVKFPLSGALSSVIGRAGVQSLNVWFGRLPLLRYLTYAIIIEAEKPTSA